MTKHRYSRREFMGLSSAGVAGLIATEWPGRWPGQAAAAALDPASEPDLVIFNGTIHTADPLKPRAQAFAVKAGRFKAVGDTGELNGRGTDRARNVLNNVGRRPKFTADEMLRRNRDALTFISKQFVRYGLTSVHPECGDLFALQEVRSRGDLLHRVSYEAQYYM